MLEWLHRYKPPRMTYTVRIWCNNCRHHGDAELPIGVEADEGKIRCPRCGCESGRRATN